MQMPTVPLAEKFGVASQHMPQYVGGGQEWGQKSFKHMQRVIIGVIEQVKKANLSERPQCKLHFSFTLFSRALPFLVWGKVQCFALFLMLTNHNSNLTFLSTSNLNHKVGTFILKDFNFTL